MNESPPGWPALDGEMAARIRGFDWAATPLGPIAGWSPALKAIVQLVLGQRTPSCLCAGDDGILIYNDAWAAMVGGKHPAVLGTSVLASFAEIDFADIFRRVLVGETIDIHDFYAPYARDGAILPAWFDVHYVPARDENGAILGMFAFVRDNTARVLAEAARDRLGARQAFLLELADAMRVHTEPLGAQHSAMALLGSHLRVDRAFYFDAAAERDGWLYTIERDYQSTPGMASMVGCYRQADFGMRVLEVMACGENVAVVDVRDDARIGAAERRNYLALGVVGYVCAPVLKGGRLVGGVCLHSAGPRAWTADEITLVRDVAERTWDALERTRAENALRDADRRKDEFLATLAHELRNPIFAIRNASRVLVAGDDRDSPVRWAELIERQSHQLGGLVDDLLDVSRITRGQVTLRRRHADLRDIVRSALPLMLTRAQSRRQVLGISLPTSPVPVLVDELRIEQVLQNLVGNAVKYSEAGGRIEVAVERGADEAVLRVRDDGIGMTADVLARAFDLFAQAERGLARSEGGLGVGLTIVRQLVDQHGGSVVATSAGLGHGSEFVVRLPLSAHEAVEDARAVAASEHPPARMPAAPSREPASGTGTTTAPRVLVVDDQADCAERLAYLLRMEGIDARVAVDGAGAIAQIADWRPHIVLLDIGLPDLDGYEVARRLRASPGGAALRLIAVSGYGQPDDVERAFVAGFDRHFLKPVSAAKLLGAIAEESGRA